MVAGCKRVAGYGLRVGCKDLLQVAGYKLQAVEKLRVTEYRL